MAFASSTTAGSARLVAPDRERESEGEEEPDDPEQRGLKDGERLSERLGSVPKPAAEQPAADGDAEDNGEEEEAECQLLSRKNTHSAPGEGVSSRVLEPSDAGPPIAVHCDTVGRRGIASIIPPG